MSEAELREAWAVRMRIMRLLPGHTAEEDWVYFRDTASKMEIFKGFRDGDGALRATFFTKWHELKREGRRYPCCLLAFTYIDPVVRNNLSHHLRMAAMVGMRMLSLRTTTLYLHGTMHLTAFLSLSTLGSERFTLQEVHPDSAEAWLLRRLATEENGDRFDIERGVARTAVVPHELRARAVSWPPLKPALQFYLQVNPGWQHGEILPVLFRWRLAHLPLYLLNRALFACHRLLSRRRVTGHLS